MSNFPPQGGFPDQGGFPPQGGFGGGAAAPPQKSSKKWLFIAGGGCLLLVIIGVVAVVGLVGFGVYGLATSEASLAAQAFVQQSGTIKAELGEPLSTTWSGGNIEINNGIGKAQQVILVTGPKGAGTVTVILSSTNNGPWSVTQADYTGPNGKASKLK